MGVVDGRFDPQNQALLVVHLERVVIEPMLDPRPLGPRLHIAGHFSLEVPVQAAMLGHPPAEKPHHVGARDVQ